MLGGQICVIISGGAPLDSEVSKFFRAALSCPVIEGYGSTETVGVLSLTLLGESETNVAGALANGIEVKLNDVPDMGLVYSRDHIGEVGFLFIMSVRSRIFVAFQLDVRGKFDHSSVADCLFFKKFRKMLGGQICVIISGGAPLDSEVSKFFRAALSCPVIEGYGSTETVGVLSLTLLGESETNVAGALANGIEVKLNDVPDMGLVYSRDHIGEICVRGMRCTRGYFKDPENTHNLYDDDGWLHTGDVGQWTPTGALKLIDRCKNMFKLTQGEYIAAEKVEGIYQCCPMILCILVDGDPMHAFAVAVAYPDFVCLRRELAGADIRRSDSGLSDEQLCQDLDVRKFVLNTINATARARGLKSFELTGALKLIDRCKNMFKLTQGEYIAAEKVEGIYQCCPMILCILVDGDPMHAFAVAVAYPDFVCLRRELAGADIRRSDSGLSDEQLCQDLDVRKFVLNTINATARARGLKSFELAKSIHLCHKPFTVESGLLTPTLKVARYRARVVFKEDIRKLYEEGELVR
ncbi:hypothetical protein AHF37_04560 [Paragonimus kellicotti]|nr:hypothetical protein AHF37_04560 [Paragonimus kellicotti]